MIGHVRYWHKADKGGFWPAVALSANDPKRTSLWVADMRRQEFIGLIAGAAVSVSLRVCIALGNAPLLEQLLGEPLNLGRAPF
jgi:hypothetical protein